MAFLDLFRKPKPPVVAPATEPVRTWLLTLAVERRAAKTRLMNGIREIWIPDAHRRAVEALENGSGMRADCAFLDGKMQLVTIHEVTAPGERTTPELLRDLEGLLRNLRFEEAEQVRGILLARPSADASPDALEKQFRRARCRELQTQVSGRVLELGVPDRLPIAIFAVESALGVVEEDAERTAIEAALTIARRTEPLTPVESAALQGLQIDVTPNSGFALAAGLARLLLDGESWASRESCRRTVLVAIEILAADGESAGFGQDLAQEIQRRYAERRIQKYAPAAAKQIVRLCWKGTAADGTDVLLVVLRDERFGLLQKMKTRWKFFEGPRDEVLATIPDALFEEATSAAFKQMN